MLMAPATALEDGIFPYEAGELKKPGDFVSFWADSVIHRGNPPR